MIRLRCGQCGRGLVVADTCAGHKGRCPHCRHVVHVPVPGETPQGEPERSDGAGSRSEVSERDRALLDLPERTSQAASDAIPDVPGCGIPAAIEGAGEADAEASAGPADAFLYPANADGLVQIGAIVLAWWAVGLFQGAIARLLGPYAGILVIILKAIVVGYLIFFTGFCIFDSSRGERRAPSATLAPTPDRGELFSQMLLLLASTAISFWPAAVYYGVTGRVDMWCAVLAVSCAFFWPMAVLAAVLFDGIDALNPLPIIRSIAVTLPAYLLLAFELGSLAALAILIRLVSMRLPVPQGLWNVAYLYLLFVGAHLLGRFYWRQKDRLQWGL